MDFTSLIEIVVAVVVVCFFVKFIVSPVIKVILGIVVFLILIYILQRFFGFNLDQVFAPFGISLNLNRWESSFNWILGPVNYYISKIILFFHFAWENVPKK